MQVVDLRCEYMQTVLLADVEFVVEVDEPLALLGPSGAGKSLVLRCLLGLAPRAMRVTGRVVVNGEEVDLSRGREVAGTRGRRLTLLPQAAAAGLDPVRTLGRQLSEVLAVHGNREDSPEQLMAMVGLPREFLLRHPLALSGGQAQRAALALALGCRPAVLLADEPTASLDNVGQAALLAVVRETCAARRISLVLVTHDVAVAATVCEAALVIDGGRVIEAGRMREILINAAHATTRGLVAAARRADGLWGARG